jgi:hypothetical protein
MSAYEVPQPILSSPFEEPKEHWHFSIAKKVSDIPSIIEKATGKG